MVLLFLAVVAELVTWAVLPFNGYDTYSHIFWIDEWHKLWSAGIFYPRWISDSFGSFGAPSFYFYPPLTFFLSSTLYAMLPSVEPATIGKLLSLIITFASLGSIFLYLRWRNGIVEKKLFNLLASTLYAFALYRFFDYSVRGAISEHLAFVSIPIVFWGLDLVLQDRKKADAINGYLLLTLGLSALILTNLPSTAATGLCLGIFALANTKRLRGIVWLAATTISALLLCGFYIVPLINHFNDVQLARLWRSESILLSSPITALLTGENITIDIVTLATFIGGCALAFKIKDAGIRWIVWIILFLQIPGISYYLFHFVPPFTIIQLSYRLFVVLILLVALLWSDDLNANTSRWPSYVVSFWSLLVLGLSLQLLSGVHVHKYGDWPIGEAPEYATRWEKPYTTYGASLNYIDALSQPFNDASENVILGNGQITRSVRALYSDTIEYNAGTNTTATLRRTWWPSWSASIDGNAVATQPDSMGRLMVKVPAGEHALVVRLYADNSITWGCYISLVSIGLIALAYSGVRKRVPN